MRAVFARTTITAVALCTLISSVSAEQTDVGLEQARGLEQTRAIGQTWLLNTRRAPRCGRLESDLSRVQFSRLVDRQWMESSYEQSVSENDPSLPVVVYVHGNRTNNIDAIDEGTNLKYRLASFSQEPFNFVIWSWPSNRVSKRNRIDVRTKATRSDAQSYYLAIWLRSLRENNGETPVSLVGYSFGSRIICGALHMLGGGRLAGRELPELKWKEAETADANSDEDVEQSAEAQPQEAQWSPLRVVIVAGALDADWLRPGRRNGLALSQVDQMLVTRNIADPVLKWYPLIGNCRSDAIGYVGPRSCGCPYSGGGKILTLDVTCQVGRDHAWRRYINSRRLNAHLASYTLPDTAEPSMADSSKK